MDGGSRVVSELPFQQFPYREEDQFKASSGEVLSVLRPTIAVRLQHNNVSWSVRALIDSGAPHTVFDRGTADALGINLSSSDARYETFRVAGDDRVATMKTVGISIPVGPFKDMSWRVEAGFFIVDWGMPFSGLLGQDGFFDKWVVSFDYPRSFVIEARETFVSRLPPALTEEQLQELWEWQELGWRGQPGQR